MLHADAPIRSMRDFYKRYLPDHWSELVRADPPGLCPECEQGVEWKRVWGSWRCTRCGHLVRDEDR